MADRTQEARERADVQADINVVLDTLLKADEMIEWYRRQTNGTRALAVIHAIDALGRIGSEAYDCQAAIERSLLKMARLRQADEVLDGYESDLEDIKAKLHAKHARVSTIETALRESTHKLEHLKRYTDPCDDPEPMDPDLHEDLRELGPCIDRCRAALAEGDNRP